MLILTRKLNESIVIGDNIRITVASLKGGTVRIGIQAPKEVAIFREELRLGGIEVASPSEDPIRHQGQAS